jgi:hypothetical protein
LIRVFSFKSLLSCHREEYESDECIYVGSVRNGAATWREGVILHCNDSRLQRKNEDFNLKLHVKNAGVDVDLNNVKLGSVSTQGQNIARGGFFGTFERKLFYRFFVNTCFKSSRTPSSLVNLVCIKLQ